MDQAGRAGAGSRPALGEPLLTEIETCSRLNSIFRSSENHPRIELVPLPDCRLRYTRPFPIAGNERATGDPSAGLSDSDRWPSIPIHPDDLSAEIGRAPRRRSCRFWCMKWVHHLQSLAGSNRGVRRRGKDRYTAQERWLALFGHDLAQDFELDGFSLFARPKASTRA